MDKTIRYCLDCRKNTTRKRKEKDLHSSCSICKGSWSAKRKDKIIKVPHRSKFKKEKVFFKVDE